MDLYSTSDPSSRRNRIPNQFHLLVDEVEEYAIFLLDREGHVVSWNRGAKKIKGYDEEEILGRHFSIFYPEEMREAGLPEEGLHVATRQGDWTDEGWRLRKDGSRFWARVTVTSLFDKAGHLQGYAKVTRDLSEQHQREEELKRQKEASEEARKKAKEAVQRAERENALLRLTQNVTAIANEAESLKQALEETVGIVCDHINWPIGHVYWRRPGNNRPLISSNLWHVTGRDRFDTLRSVSESAHFDLGESLPGLVAKKGGPVWIEDVIENPNFVRGQKVRAEHGDNLGIKSAFAVPVQTREETVAVLEFFSPDRTKRDEKLLEVIGSVGTQLSRVAERVKARRQLRQSEQRYRHLFEDSLEGIAITTPGGEIVDANPAALRILGYRREELQQLNVIGLYAHPMERRRIQAQLRKNEQIRGQQVRFRRSDGEEIICEISVTVRPGGEGERKVYQTTFRDVTERKAAEAALRESEEKFRTLAEGALVGIALVQEGRYEYVNPALAKILGYDREELLGTSPKRVVHSEDWSQVQQQFERRLVGEAKIVRYETRIRTKQGEIRHLKVAGSRTTYGGAPALISTVQDITEERRLQRELLEVQENERRRIGQDLHDGVASQLTGARLYLDTLRAETKNEHPDLSKKVKKVLALVKESGEDLRRLTRGLNPVVLEDGGLLTALERLSENTEGCVVERTCPSEVFSELKDKEEAHCYWLIQEAVANARRHGKADEIAIRLRQEEDSVVLKVVDDGSGFDVSDTGSEGTGLRTMEYRAELLGANLTIDSAPGEGATVECRIPLNR